MSKIIFLGDAHFGVRADSIHFVEFQRKFYVEQFIPYCLEHGITRIIQFGDLFDKRQSINFRSLYHAKKMFFDLLQEHGIQLIVFLGNHDIFYLDSLHINSPSLLLKEYDNVVLYDKPTTLQISQVTFDIIPWICKENYAEVMSFISASHSDYCLGHFDITGAFMYKGMLAEHGLDPNLFKKYTKVWSGHFHTRSIIQNIEYIGTPMEMTWQDYDDPRGFTVYDTHELTQEFIANKYTIFTKIEYNQETFNHQAFNYDSLKEQYVKIIVLDKTNPVKYDQFIQKVMLSGAHDISIIENFQSFQEGAVEEDIELEDTITVVNSYIDSLEAISNKDKLKTLLQHLYIKALNIESL